MMIYSHKELTGMFQNTMEATEQCRTLQNIMETHKIIQNLTELHRTGRIAGLSKQIKAEEIR